MSARVLVLATSLLIACAPFPPDLEGPTGIRPDRWGSISVNDWLINQSHPLGGWSANPIQSLSRHPGDEWEFIENDISITANCLLPFLINGHCNPHSCFHKVVWNGIEILLKAQDERGLFVSDDQPGWLYRQASVVRALSYGVGSYGTRSENDRLQRAVERGEDALNVTSEQWNRATDVDPLLRLRVILIIAHGLGEFSDRRLERHRELKAIVHREFAREDFGVNPTDQDYVRDLKHLRAYGSRMMERSLLEWIQVISTESGPDCDDPRRTFPDLRMYWSHMISLRRPTSLPPWRQQLDELVNETLRYSTSPRCGGVQETRDLLEFAHNLTALWRANAPPYIIFVRQVDTRASPQGEVGAFR